MPSALWVHRLSADEAGAPPGKVSLEEVENDLSDVARAVMLGPRDTLEDDPSRARAFLVSELFERGALRQGWGAPGMRLTRKSEFLKHYVIAMWRYWRAIPVSVRDDLRREGAANYSRLFEVLAPYYREAAGRYSILVRLVEMHHGDIVFLPNIREKGASFSVARVDDREYRFEDRARGDARSVWEIDYGHVRRVRGVREFPYGPATLDRGVFSAPYLHAIDRVSTREQQLRAFIDAHFS